MPLGYSLLFIGIENPNKGLATAWLNRLFLGYGGGVIPCLSTGATSIDDTTGTVVLMGVDITASSTVDSTGCSTTFWGLFCELTLPIEGYVIFGKDLSLLKCIQATQNNSCMKTNFIRENYEYL